MASSNEHDRELSAVDQQAAREHRDNVARLRAALDQDGERVAMLGENVAAFWLGLVKGGVPETHAVFIASQYTQTILQQGADIRAAAEREARRNRGEL
jgi:hypothetical protein